jgi:1-acyl-sn-glycerol-3-phosphate acyltransferase
MGDRHPHPRVASRRVTPTPVGSLTFGLDDDRVSPPERPVSALRRRLDGRYPRDPFGLDPHLQDLVSPLFGLIARVEVEGGDHIPARGPGLLVSNRGLGLIEPAVLGIAVRRERGRRLRIVGTPDMPVLGDALRALGGIPAYPDDVAALLRAGHLAAVPLGPTWLRTGVGTPPLELLLAATGFPVLPVAVAPGGPLGLPVRRWRVKVGEAIVTPGDPDDPLEAAELAEAARAGVRDLLRGHFPPG